MLMVYLHPAVDRNFSVNTISNWLRKQTTYLLKPKAETITSKAKSKVEQASREEKKFAQLVSSNNKSRKLSSKVEIPTAYSDLKGQLVLFAN